MNERGPVEAVEGGVRIHVKAVPGASRDQVAGVLGDRVKVRVSAPPEGGRANKAIVSVLARLLGVKPGAVTIVSGLTSPEKALRVAGVTIAAARGALGIPEGEGPPLLGRPDPANDGPSDHGAGGKRRRQS